MESAEHPNTFNSLRRMQSWSVGCSSLETKAKGVSARTVGLAASKFVDVLEMFWTRVPLIVPFFLLSLAGVLSSSWQPLAQTLCPIQNPTIWSCSNNCRWISRDEHRDVLRQPRMVGSDVSSTGTHIRCAHRWLGIVGTQSRCTSSKYGGRWWRHTTIMERPRCRDLRSWPRWAKRILPPSQKEPSIDGGSYGYSCRAGPNGAHDATSNARCLPTQRTQLFGTCISISVQ